MPPRKTRARQDHYATPVIVIERRVIVATIEQDPHGEHPMLRAAFMAASDALADSLTDERSFDRLEFTHGDHRFTVAAEPENPKTPEAAEPFGDSWDDPAGE